MSLQGFAITARPQDGPPRLAALRAAMADAGYDAWLVPRADAHQGEYVAPCDERLAWLTGFTGSAGFALVTAARAGVFADGRYRVQLRQQVDTGHFAPVDWPETKPGPWLVAALPGGGRLGFDPWLTSVAQRDELQRALAGSGIELAPGADLVAPLWADRPAPPAAPVVAHPDELAGMSAAVKRERLAATLRAEGARAAVLTLTDSVAWLLNIRGGDIPRVPVPRAFAILHDDARVELFLDAPGRVTPEARAGMGQEGVRIAPQAGFETALDTLKGPVRLHRESCPVAVAGRLAARGIEPDWGAEPCRLPKACKTPAELAGARAAHLRDGAAVTGFLAWLDAQPPGSLTEIAVVKRLETFRQATGRLRDISFETIAGSGPNGAIVHYRVTEASDRRLAPGDLLLLDSGGQYADGTTDITRTLALGPPGEAERAAFTRVLKGMIAISMTRWPKGLAGRDLDALARWHLWQAGQDYDHGTGHGVGSYLSVHEGPQRLSRLGETVLEPGMILSNEPGYYRAGAFGIRIENLVAVRPAPDLPGGDAREMLEFETLTLAPIDRRLIVPEMLSGAECAWLDAYHARVAREIGPLLDPGSRDWLARAVAPLRPGGG